LRSSRSIGSIVSTQPVLVPYDSESEIQITFSLYPTCVGTFVRSKRCQPANARRIAAYVRYQTEQSPPPRCFIVKDANGLAVAHVYYEEEPGRRTTANLMTRDEARRIAANIAKIPEYRRGDAALELTIRQRTRVLQQCPE
jgi:hypothetical protein